MITNRRGFLKTAAAALLGALLPVRLLGRGKAVAKRFDVSLGLNKWTEAKDSFLGNRVEFAGSQTIDFDGIDIDKDGVGEYLKTLDCPFEVHIIGPVQIDPECKWSYSYVGEDGENVS